VGVLKICTHAVKPYLCSTEIIKFGDSNSLEETEKCSVHTVLGFHLWNITFKTAHWRWNKMFGG